LPRLLTDVSRNMVEGWRNGMTPFDEFTATFNLRDGIAETVDLQLAGKDVSLTGKGEADLLRRAIEFKIDPKFSAGATVASLPVPVVVKGSWYKPKFYPDMPGILENPDAAYKALKELGAPAAEAH
jgi:AsmA protein